ncbi:MAG: hypothetical protein Ct9H300mP28_31210 [Pseudomonadota bacterium]|nr:MAG: hypothetical protein Ct9H300mP28_31210 [Pseudomonadota bacterium]
MHQQGMASTENPFFQEGLKVRRRAPAFYKELIEKPDSSPSEVMDWVSLFAIAVKKKMLQEVGWLQRRQMEEEGLSLL